jgi:death-on-curing protein
MEPEFLSLDEVLEIHAQQIEQYGGSAGLRDGDGLESAVATPQVTFGGEFLHKSIPAMAAAYLFHLCQNHAFIDGNKRVGANAAITFLPMNNWEPAFAEKELVDLVLWTATIRPASYTAKLKIAQMKELGPRGRPEDYKEDKLSLEVGGNPTDPKNLWPRP